MNMRGIQGVFGCVLVSAQLFPLHACSLHACFQCICAKLVWTHAPSMHSTKHPKVGQEGNSRDHAPFIHPTKHTRHVFGSFVHLWLATLFQLHGPHVIDSTSCQILPHLWCPFCQPHFLWQTQGLFGFRHSNATLYHTMLPNLPKVRGCLVSRAV